MIKIECEKIKALIAARHPYAIDIRDIYISEDGRKIEYNVLVLGKKYYDNERVKLNELSNEG